LQKLKAFEDAVYSASVGQPTLPVRSAEGFHLIKVHFRRPNFGKIQAAYINIPCTTGSVTRSKEAVARLAAEAYNKAIGGEDFSDLVETYSADTLHKGVLPPFFPGDFVTPIEDAVCALEKPGDITPPVITETGAYLFKLIEKKGRDSFNDAKAAIIDNMRKTEWNFVLYKAFDDYLKKEYNYVFHPEAYAELEKLCDNYFPDSNDFPAHAKDMNKTLIELNGEDFPQKEFVYYIRKNPFSAKTYSKDLLKEVFALFVRDIATMFERRNLETKHPDMPHLIQEYRDGILLFELSNIMVWSHPLEEQDGLERQWLKELNDKYPVTINWPALKKLTRKQ
jgi:peptidyl-prolyl cis-trans isomerase SurA